MEYNPLPSKVFQYSINSTGFARATILKKEYPITGYFFGTKAFGLNKILTNLPEMGYLYTFICFMETNHE
jgi:hypothetical protein